jgi:serine/arginine repetitive matrix protein 2
MYNGIGIPTPKGSGTSGHITRNESHIPKRRMPLIPSKGMAPENMIKAPHQSILDYRARRKILVARFELAKRLDKEGVLVPDIAMQVLEAFPFANEANKKPVKSDTSPRSRDEAERRRK